MARSTYGLESSVVQFRIGLITETFQIFGRKIFMLSWEFDYVKTLSAYAIVTDANHVSGRELDRIILFFSSSLEYVPT